MNTGDSLLQYALGRLQEQYKQDELKKRQMELAAFNDKLRAAQAKDARDHSLLTQGIADPTGQQFEALARAGETEIGGLPLAGLRHTPDMAIGKVAEDINKVSDRRALPTHLGIETMMRGRAGIDPRNPEHIAPLTNLATSKAQAFDAADAIDIENAGQTSFAQAYGTEMGKTDPDVTASQVTHQNTVEAGTRGEKVKTAGATAYASSYNTQRAAQTVENTNPITEQVAMQVMSKPELLDGLTPGMRNQVLAAMSSEKFRSQSQKAAEPIITSARQALNTLIEGRGMAGAVGAPSLFEPGSLSRLVGMDPLAGSASADYTETIKQLTSALTLPRLSVLKGLGHMSDREFNSVVASVTKLGTRLSEGEFQKELRNIDTVLADMEMRAGMTPGSSFKQEDGSDLAAPLESGRAKLKLRLGGS